jgi:hypothetical protein
LRPPEKRASSSGCWPILPEKRQCSNLPT